MKVEIILPYHSDERLFSACLDSLLGTTPPDISIRIVRNNENLDECSVKRRDSRVLTMEIPQSVGYAKAANLGAAQSDADIFIFVDQDIVLTPGWYESLLQTAITIEDAGIVGVKLLSPSTGRILDYGIGLDEFNNFHLHWDRLSNFDDERKYYQTQAVCSACIAVDAASFKAIGGFDEKLGTLYTDIDLCLRMKHVGKTCYVSSKSMAYHFGSKTITVKKSYKSSTNKVDANGYFRMKNAGVIDYELSKYFTNSIQQVFDSNEISASYIVANMVNVYNPEFYVDLLRNRLDVRTVHRLPTMVRDALSVNLYWHLGYHLAMQNAPIVYLVDRYYSLRDNELWWKVRKSHKDIIVDRHCTCMTVQSAIEDFRISPEVYTNGRLPSIGERTSDI